MTARPHISPDCHCAPCVAYDHDANRALLDCADHRCGHSAEGHIPGGPCLHSGCQCMRLKTVDGAP